jgi:hypothetical protein
MEGSKTITMILYVLGLLLGLIAIIMTFTGLPGNFDTEPLLGFGIFLIALGGLLSLKK